MCVTFITHSFLYTNLFYICFDYIMACFSINNSLYTNWNCKLKFLWYLCSISSMVKIKMYIVYQYSYGYLRTDNIELKACSLLIYNVWCKCTTNQSYNCLIGEILDLPGRDLKSFKNDKNFILHLKKILWDYKFKIFSFTGRCYQRVIIVIQNCCAIYFFL